MSNEEDLMRNVVDRGTGEMDEWWCMFYDCPSCEAKSEIPPGVTFCSNCGVRLIWPKEEDVTFEATK